MGVEVRSTKAGVSIDWLESSAVGASFICLIHCLALPFLLAALPALASILPVSETFHLWVLAFAVPAATAALWIGRNRHGAVGPLVTGGIGLASLAIGALALGETRWEIPITVAGSLTLAFAHLWNWGMRHSFGDCSA